MSVSKTSIWWSYCWIRYLEWRLIQGQHSDNAALEGQSHSVDVWHAGWLYSKHSCRHTTVNFLFYRYLVVTCVLISDIDDQLKVEASEKIDSEEIHWSISFLIDLQEITQTWYLALQWFEVDALSSIKTSLFKTLKEF